MVRITSQYNPRDKSARAARNVYAKLLKLYAEQQGQLHQLNLGHGEQ